MRVFVTGGNGFIGKHVIKELLSRNIEVVSFDIMPSEECLDGVKYVKGTIIDEFTLGRHLRGCDAVLHLAAVLGVRRADLDLLKCLTINIMGTLKVLEASVMAGISHVLITSSSEIFGDCNESKYSEDSPLNPKSGYAISKLAAEQYAKGFRKEYGLDYNIIRFFNIYGPGQVADFVVPRFIKHVQKGVPPKIYGDGKQVRSFCHISDASKGLVNLFLNENARNKIFNVGNDSEPITIKELADKVIKKSGSNLKPEFIPFSESDRNRSREIFYRVPDISKIKTLINYGPKVMLDEGIQSIIDNGDIPEFKIE